MELKSIKRQNEREHLLIDTLTKMRHDEMMESDVEKLTKYHIVHGLLTQTEKEFITKNALWVFATNEKKIKKNQECLQALNTNENPVAKIFPKSSRTCGRTGSGVRSHFTDNAGSTPVLICINAQVHIQGRNFRPRWGLYNGSIGYVREIVYIKGKNPNNLDFPSYVVVEFPQYCGPPWHNKNPKVRILNTANNDNINTDIYNSACTNTSNRNEMQT